MKKLLIKLLKLLLKKLVKPRQIKWEMSEQEKNRNLFNSRKASIIYGEDWYSKNEELKNEELKKEELSSAYNIYVYNESDFSISIENIPSKLIQSYFFIGDNKVVFEIILGGEGDFDVYEQLQRKNGMVVFEKEIQPEDIEIIINSAISRKITLKNIKVTKINAFGQGKYGSNSLQKATVTVEFASKFMEKV